MAAEVQELRVPGDKSIRISKWKVRQGSHISKGVLMAIYNTEEKEKDTVQQKLKAPNAGIVKRIIAKEGQLCEPGSILVEIGPQSANLCSHPTVMKDMCAECGADLRCELGLAGDRKEPVEASVAMVHCIPELIVSEEVALELGKADENRLLSCRKLALLVDLDQTLIHTTNDAIPNNLKDVYHFQLWHGRKLLWYHTKFRPGTKEFLEKISKLFELHICTFGVRMYAHTIARFIDPDGKYFSHRIVSRDECFDAMSKTANLKALFPCGDCMVAIIDDREDVWNFAPNLIHVKPYHFFQGTADINAPPGLTKTENDSVPVSHEVRRSSSETRKLDEPETVKSDDLEKQKSSEPQTQNSDKPQTQKLDEPEAMEVESDSDRMSTDGDKDLVKDNINSSSNQSDENSNKTAADNKNSLHSDNSVADVSNSKGNYSEQSATSTTDDKSKKLIKSQNSEEEVEVIEWVDEDDYLIYLTDILTRIHTAYYDVYDQMKDKQDMSELPNIKNIIPYVKRKVLKGVNIVFSGVVPLNMAPEKCRAYIIAKTLGANIHTNIISRKENPEEATTHLVTSKAGTAKYKLASKMKNICIVNLDWLLCCSYRWERVDERLFPVSDDSSGSYCDSPITNADSLRKLSKKQKRKAEDIDNVFGIENSQDSNSLKRAKKDEDMGEDALSKSRFATSFNPLFSFSDEDIECMDKEVEDLMDDDDEDASDEDEVDRHERVRNQVLSNPPEESSTDDSLDANFPRGWKKKTQSEDDRKEKVKEEDSDAPVPDEDSENELDKFQKNLEAFSPDSNMSDSDKDSIGSVDDEIADAVEKEFLSML
ncbi:hypothetical protein SNE40_007614 [Patella caerulea]|uniref:RNA polymerase II subunit A C-terminal domain phosphatase n=1 Tax=Patella caerulea TaxID=87958 RepID=A0AAN8JYV6_PATCE